MKELKGKVTETSPPCAFSSRQASWQNVHPNQSHMSEGTPLEELSNRDDSNLGGGVGRTALFKVSSIIKDTDIWGNC